LAYLAPEVYEGKGYSCEVDWWSLGVLFYECIYNKVRYLRAASAIGRLFTDNHQRPFEASNHERLGQKIIRANPTYPVTSPPVSMVCNHGISSLLEKDRKQRIGAVGWETFIDNPFFRAIDFEALERLEIEPIFKPASDKTNFDATYDLEELLLEEAPLEARARRQKPREVLKDDATDQERRAEELHKMIETLFEPFNYTTSLCKEISAGNTPTTTQSGNSPIEPTTSPAAILTASTPGAHTPAGAHTPGAMSRSNTQSPSGSPPLPKAPITGEIPRSIPADYFPATVANTNTHDYADSGGGGGGHSYSPHRPTDLRRQGNTRSTSQGGGVQVVLNEEGSWTDMADRTGGATAAAATKNADKEGSKDKPSGMLGFLSRKKGRDRSPKARERGVLGKEGARVVVGNI